MDVETRRAPRLAGENYIIPALVHEPGNATVFSAPPRRVPKLSIGEDCKTNLFLSAQILQSGVCPRTSSAVSGAGGRSFPCAAWATGAHTSCSVLVGISLLGNRSARRSISYTVLHDKVRTNFPSTSFPSWITGLGPIRILFLKRIIWPLGVSMLERSNFISAIWPNRLIFIWTVDWKCARLRPASVISLTNPRDWPHW